MQEREKSILQEWDLREKILGAIRSNADGAELRELLDGLHALETADLLKELSSEERERLGRILGSEAMSEIVSYLDDASEYLRELDADEAAEIVGQMDADEAQKALEDLDEQTRGAILRRIEDDGMRREIALIDSYEDDEFGSRMSTNFISVKRGETVKGAMRTLVRDAAENDNIYTIFVVEEDGSLYGTIELKDLIVARHDVELPSLVSTALPFVYDTDRIPERIERLCEYSEEMIPVLSRESGVLLGVITASELTEMLDEARADDYAKLAAMTGEEERHESLLGSMRKRVPWLIVLLFLGLAVSAVVGLFEGVVDELPMMVSFQSLILGMAGNVGTQSLAVTVRALADGERRPLRAECLIVLRELRVALLGGAVLGLISFLTVSGYLVFFTSYGAVFALSAAVCVGLAMCFAMAASGLTGSAIPILLGRMGVDPAIASGPLITTASDLVAVFSYYGLAILLLLGL